MKHETSAALHAYWLSCHRAAGVPPLGIRAEELAPILPCLFLIDLASGLRFRFCGATIATRYGRDLTNDSFLDPWNAEDRETLRQHVRTMARQSTGLVAGVLAESVAGGFTSYETLLLPLVGETGAAGAIGSMARVGGNEETNRIRARIASQWLRSVRFLPASNAGAARIPLLAGAALSRLPAPAHRRYRHLTVLTGGK